VALGVLLVAGVAVMAARNLGYTGMWWDESASFWNSQGLGRYAEPFAQRRGWRDVVRMNRAENLDPGGHTLLLHLWTRAGTGLAWLRAFSLLFLVAGCAALGALGWHLTRAAPFALAATGVPLLYPAARYFAFEIRAYGMEMAGVAVVALLVARAAERPADWRLALLGLAGAGFLSSRYSFALVLAAAALALAWTWLTRRDAPRAVARRLAVAALPVAAAGAAIVWVTLRVQMWHEMRQGPLGLAAPVYTRAAVLDDSPDPIGLLAANLLAPAALPITLALVAALAGLRRAAQPAAALNALYAMVLSVQGVSAGVSLLGWYPWDLRSRWSAYLVMVSAVAAVTLAADVVREARARLGRRPAGTTAARTVGAISTATAALAVALAAAAAAGHRQDAEALRRTDLARQIELLPALAPGPGAVLVTFYEVPVLRYLYEHGPFHGRPEYPLAFRWETEHEHWQRRPIDAAREGIRYVVTAWPAQALEARLPGTVLATVGPPGNRLLRVATSAPDTRTTPGSGGG